MAPAIGWPSASVGPIAGYSPLTLTAATRAGVIPGCSSSRRTTSAGCSHQLACMSCSTQPGCGYAQSYSTCACACTSSGTVDEYALGALGPDVQSEQQSPLRSWSPPSSGSGRHGSPARWIRQRLHAPGKSRRHGYLHPQVVHPKMLAPSQRRFVDRRDHQPKPLMPVLGGVRRQRAERRRPFGAFGQHDRTQPAGRAPAPVPEPLPTTGPKAAEAKPAIRPVRVVARPRGAEDGGIGVGDPLPHFCPIIPRHQAAGAAFVRSRAGHRTQAPGSAASGRRAGTGSWPAVKRHRPVSPDWRSMSGGQSCSSSRRPSPRP